MILAMVCYLFAIFGVSVYAAGVVTEAGTYRVSQENAEIMLIMWVFALLFGYFILNGMRIMFITVIAYCKA